MHMAVVIYPYSKRGVGGSSIFSYRSSYSKKDHNRELVCQSIGILHIVC